MVGLTQYADIYSSLDEALEDAQKQTQ
jgi:hypothetical protein